MFMSIDFILASIIRMMKRLEAAKKAHDEEAQRHQRKAALHEAEALRAERVLSKMKDLVQ